MSITPTKLDSSPPTGTVLVIDDSEIARAEMMRLLSAAGYKAIELASPIGATRAILDNQVRAVVIDFWMPGMRGDRLAALFRGNPRFTSLGVVIVSGESELELHRMSIDAGADAVVLKSELHRLVGAVQASIRLREGRSVRHG